MNESYGGNIPARIWARFMKAALAGTPPHDFPFPADEVAKVAGCGRGYEYFLKGTEPQYGCGGYTAQNGPTMSRSRQARGLRSRRCRRQTRRRRRRILRHRRFRRRSRLRSQNLRQRLRRTPAKVVVTVGEFSKRLQEVFRRVRAFDYIGISGEVSEWTPRANGIYFTLKDAAGGLAVLRVP